MYLPRRPLELASPFGCLSVAELSMRRGFCPDHAASTTAPRFLQPALLFLIVVLDAGDPRALLIREHPCDGRARPHFGAGLSCIREIGDDRIGERASWTADVAPAVVDAGW